MKYKSLFEDSIGGGGNKLVEGIDYYFGDGGYKIFTEKYLLKRGYCCQNGCKHCPYGFDKNKGRIEK